MKAYKFGDLARAMEWGGSTWITNSNTGETHFGRIVGIEWEGGKNCWNVHMLTDVARITVFVRTSGR